jgi:hypothetical protein
MSARAAQGPYVMAPMPGSSSGVSVTVGRGVTDNMLVQALLAPRGFPPHVPGVSDDK